jgi:hypothetical protein
MYEYIISILEDMDDRDKNTEAYLYYFKNKLVKLKNKREKNNIIMEHDIELDLSDY